MSDKNIKKYLKLHAKTIIRWIGFTPIFSASIIMIMLLIKEKIVDYDIYVTFDYYGEAWIELGIYLFGLILFFGSYINNEKGDK